MAVLSLCLFTGPSHAGVDPSQVVVLYNEADPSSLMIAEHYAQVHPGVKLHGLSGVTSAEEVSQGYYLNTIRPQVLAGIDSDTQMIVTTKGLPLRIRNNMPNPGRYSGWRGAYFNMDIPNDWWRPFSSLESELTRVDTIRSAEMMGDQSYHLSGSVFGFDTFHHAANPYYNRDVPFDRADPVNEGIRLTARLDGFTTKDVITSINRAQLSTLMPGGQVVVVDDDPTAPGTYADNMEQLAFETLAPSEIDPVYDNTGLDITGVDRPVIGYVSHGSQSGTRHDIDELRINLAPGAVMHTWESYNAYSFEVGGHRAGQWLAAEWLAEGGTAALGHVEEPRASADAVANEAILFDRLLQGYTLAEAAWAATVQLSFVNTVVGDPLMRFQPWVPGDANLDRVVDLTDLDAVLVNWNQPAEAYDTYSGEFTGDGFVGLKDLELILYVMRHGASPNTPPINLPEPTTAGGLLLSLPWALRRR